MSAPDGGPRRGTSPDDGHDPHDGHDPDDGASGGPAADPRVQAGLDHLQQAAREIIAASRAMLDLAEELVDDPHAVGAVVGVFGSLAKAAGRATMGRSGVPANRPHPDDEDDGGHGVQRIPVS